MYTEKKEGAKTVPLQYAILDNGALFSKTGTKTVPLLWQSAPPPSPKGPPENQYAFAKGHQNSAPKGTVLLTVPLRYAVLENGALFSKTGTKTVPFLWQRAPPPLTKRTA